MPTMVTSALDVLLDDFCVAAARRRPGDTLAIAHEIAGHGAQAVSAFVGLLRFRDRRVAVAAAHHLLQILEPDHPARPEAARILDGITDLDPAEFAWLESWRCEV